MEISAALAKAYDELEAAKAKKATVYLSSNLVVSICFHNRPYARCTRRDLVVKVGVPNYLETRFIKACKKAGEPLPVKKVQLKFWPKKKVVRG